MAVQTRDKSRDSSHAGSTQWPGWYWIDAVFIRVALLGGAVLVGVVLWRITSAEPAAGSINGTVVQMAQWAITTVFAAGAALIGLNWYQAEQRYRRDREEVDVALRRMAQTLAQADRQVAEVTAEATATKVELEQFIDAQTRRRIGDHEPMWSVVFGLLRELELPVSEYQRQSLFRQLHERIEQEAQHSDFRQDIQGPVGLQLIERIHQVEPSMQNFHAQGIVELLTRLGAQRG